MVAYYLSMVDEHPNNLFKALADPQRRQLLDWLFEEDGQPLSSLCENCGMSRQAVSKHLGILERANLVICQMEGRQKFHYLNPVPIQQVANRWLSKFSGHQASALIYLKQTLEDPDE